MFNVPPSNTYLWLIQAIAFIPLAISSYKQFKKSRSGISTSFVVATFLGALGGLVWFVPHLFLHDSQPLTVLFVAGDFITTFGVAALAALTPLIFMRNTTHRSLFISAIIAIAFTTWLGSSLQSLPDNTYIDASGSYVYLGDYTVFSVLYTVLFFIVIPAGLYFIRQSFNIHGRAKVRALSLGLFLTFGALIFGSERVLVALLDSPNSLVYIGLLPFGGLIISAVWVLFYSKPDAIATTG